MTKQILGTIIAIREPLRLSDLARFLRLIGTSSGTIPTGFVQSLMSRQMVRTLMFPLFMHPSSTSSPCRGVYQRI